MTLFKCFEIKKSFNDRDVLKNINIEINSNEKLAIVGRNGAGKTTFLNILLGKLKADSGHVIYYKKDFKLAYLTQNSDYELISFNGEFISETDCDFHKEAQCSSFSRTAANLGLKNLKELGPELKTTMSGGEKIKTALANIFIAKPDILILDEPTNHIDFDGIGWLTEEIKKYRGACIIVSHDRYFLDNTINCTIEIEVGIAKKYSGNYSYYHEEKERNYQIQLNQYYLQEKYKAKLEEDIAVLDAWSSKAHRESRKKAIETGNKLGGKEYNRVKAKKMDRQVKSRIKRLKKIEINEIEKPKKELGVNFEFQGPGNYGKRLIEVHSLTKSFSTNIIFNESNFYIARNEKIGVIGPNGCGKTTLLRLLTKEDTPDSGEIWISESAKISYLNQDNATEFISTTLEELIKNLFPEKSQRVKANNLLVSMGINETVFKTPLNNLSYGERVRIKIAILILGCNDVLILDEPTNHLDLFSREKLEEALINYQGSIILVSHDRYTLQKVCDKILFFEDKKILRYEGNFKEFEDAKLYDIYKEPSKNKTTANNIYSKINNKNHNKNKAKSQKYQQMVLEFNIAEVLSRLSILKSRKQENSEEYINLDLQYKELISQRTTN